LARSSRRDRRHAHADAKQKIAKSAQAVTDAVAKSCGATTQPLIEMFRGKCLPSPSTTAAQLSGVRGQRDALPFLVVLSISTGSFDCDDFDATRQRLLRRLRDGARDHGRGELITGPSPTPLGDTMMAKRARALIIQKPGRAE